MKQRRLGLTKLFSLILGQFFRKRMFLDRNFFLFHWRKKNNVGCFFFNGL